MFMLRDNYIYTIYVRRATSCRLSQGDAASFLHTDMRKDITTIAITTMAITTIAITTIAITTIAIATTAITTIAIITIAFKESATGL